jgi:oxalate decarboxylase/phosphoglucose isomerase-like protein (cupin superfamily)
VVAGITVTGLAALGLSALSDTPSSEPPPPAVRAAAAPAPVLAVTVQRATYQPGQSSGWHAHPGVHSVVVLSGTLTVYDAACGSSAFGPTDTYVGGQRNHLARNDTPEPVEMVVVYSASGSSTDEYVLPGAPPESCSAT